MRNSLNLKAMILACGALALAGCLGEAPPRFPVIPEDPAVADTTASLPGDTKPVYHAEVLVDTTRQRVIVPGVGAAKPDTLRYFLEDGKLELSLPGKGEILLEGAGSNSGSGKSPAGEWLLAPGGLPVPAQTGSSAAWGALGQALLSDVPLVLGFSGSDLTVSLPADYCPGARLEATLDAALTSEVSESGCNSVEVAHPTIAGVSADVSFTVEANAAKLEFSVPGMTCSLSQPLLPLLLGAAPGDQSLETFGGCLQAMGFAK